MSISWDDVSKDSGTAAGTGESMDVFGEAPDTMGDPTGFHSSTLDSQPDDGSVVDAEATEIKPKKGKILPIIIGIALIAFGAAGYIGYSFYQKMFPSAESAPQTGNAILLDSRADGDRPLDGSPQTLPGGQDAQGNGGLIPLGDSKSQPIEIVETPVPVTPAVVEPVTAAPVVETPATPVAPLVPVAPVAEPVKPAVVVAPVAVKEPVKEQVKPAVVTEAKPVKATVPRKVAAPKPVQRVVRSAPPRVAKPKTPALVKQAAAAAPEVTTESKADMGRLTAYSILAFEPKVGDFQQAWVRDSSGKVLILSKGDSFEGARVTSINFSEGVVKTTRGEIRK